MGFPLHITVLILSVASGVLCDPKLAEMRYPIFYLSPRVGPRGNMVEKLAIIPNPRQEPGEPPVITNRITVATDPETSDEEVTNFHTQDALGRFVYGFHVPNQVRMESRDHDGTVRGTYSYLDPYGNIVKMQYWDDGNGFHTAGNNLPRTPFQPPQYTPEVQAARDEHFKLYQQALAASSAVDDNFSENKDDEELIDDDSDANSDLTPAQNEDHDSDAVVVGDESLPDEDQDLPDLSRFPKFPYEQEILTPNHIIDDESDSVSIDNPELSFRKVPMEGYWYRKRKSFDLDRDLEMGSESDESGTKEESKELEQMIHAPSVSFLATKAGSIPVAAVHDVQVSPFQRASIDNHQILPVFSGHASHPQ